MNQSKTEYLESRAGYQNVGVWLGPAVVVLMMLIGPQGTLSPSAWNTAAMGLWMAIWWATEATPVGVTAFIPLIFFAREFPLDPLCSELVLVTYEFLIFETKKTVFSM